jgi:tripartite-type tricarboxylate transporter receptor subunit TctC
MRTLIRQTPKPQHLSPPRVNDWLQPKTPSSGQHPRRRFLSLAAGAAALPTVSRIARAQAYPSRPITIIVPFPSGGAGDIIGRILAEPMRGSLGQPVVIENVGGADGSIGVGRAARARPDGYTISLGPVDTHVLNGAVYSLPYDVLNDFAPISPLVTTPLILFARKNIAAKNLMELIAWLKTNPDRATAGIVTVGTNLLTAFLRKETGTQFILVPYRGVALAIQDLIGGQIDLLFGTPDQLPLMRGGSVSAFAVTSDARLSVAPDIPTFAEMGLPALSFSIWYGLFAPRATPTGIIDKLNAAAVTALTDPVVRSGLADRGYEVFSREKQTPAALGALVKADAAKWWPIIRESGIRRE